MDISRLPYRKNVSCIVFKENKFLVVQLNDWLENWWKFPQGGIEKDETEEEAAKRELFEELGTNKFKFHGKSKYTNQYDWPDLTIEETGFRWRGQFQKFFLVEFLGDDSDINIDPEEVRKYKWVGRHELFDHIYHDDKIFANYKNVVGKILREFDIETE